MRNTDIHLDYAPPGWRERLDVFLAGKGQGFNAELLTRSRLHDLLALEGFSDFELDQIGIRRDDIPAFVFADLFGDDEPDLSGDA